MGVKQTKNPKTLTPKIRAQVFYRDKFRCQAPGCGKVDHTRESLVVHHIDHDTSNNFLSNLATMCRSCNLAESNHHKSCKVRLAALYTLTKNLGTNQTYFPFGDPLG